MAETKAAAPWKVLLVDDEQSALQMYGALLREDGIPVLTAATGERARALVKSEARLGLVVLDLVASRRRGSRPVPRDPRGASRGADRHAHRVRERRHRGAGPA